MQWVTSTKLPMSLAWLISAVVSFLAGYCSDIQYWTAAEYQAEGESLPSVAGPVCSHDVLRQHYRTQGYYPGGGRWVAATESHAKVNETFAPSVCNFRWSEPPASYMRVKLKEAAITSIVIIGDSNSRMFYWAAVDYFSKIYGSSCNVYHPSSAKGVLPYKECTGGSSMENPFLTCGSARGLTNVCRHNGSVTLVLEHQGLMSLVGPKTNSLLLNLKTYFRPREPSVVVVFPPFNHMGGHQLRAVETGLRDLSRALNLYIPKSTKVYLMPGFNEFVMKKPPAIRVKDRLSIDQMNRALYKVMSDQLVKKSSRRYGLFDMVKVSQTRANWSHDGVHMLEDWYWVVINMWSQLLVEGD